MGFRSTCALLVTPSVLALAAIAAGCSTKPSNACGQNGSALETAAPVCPGPSVVKGVDVSTFDSTVDWPTVQTAGISFAIARISDGLTHPDAQFATNWAGMKSAGIVRGAYQYFRAGEDPIAQANMVIDALAKAGGLQGGDLPVVADVETADGQTAAVVETKLAAWLAAIEKSTGRPAIIYTSIGTWPVTSTTFASRPLWVANYGVTCPALPAGWSKWTFWQSSATGTVKGITSKVDLDEFNGTVAELLAFAGAGAPTDAGAPVGGGGDGGPVTVPVVDAGAPPPDAGRTMGSAPPCQ